MPSRFVVPQARNLMIENMEDMLLTVDNNNRLIDMNSAAREMAEQTSDLFKTKINAADIIGIDFQKFLGSLDFLTDDVADLFLDGNSNKAMKFIVNGKDYYFDLIKEALLDAENRKIGLLYIVRDVTATHKNLNNLIQLNEHLEISDRIINEALEGIIITNSSNRIIRVNDSFVSMSGYQYYELLGESPSLLKSDRQDNKFFENMWRSINEKGYWEGEIWDKKKNGDIYPKWMTINVIKDEEGNISNYIGISSDVSVMKKAEEDLRKMAYYDGLTDLPNRTLFLKNMELALDKSISNGSKTALIYVDLDRFKVINDTFGHSAGDQLLIQVASRFKECISETQDLSRLGGDEFTLIVEDYNEEEEKYRLVNSILEAFSRPFELKGKMIHVFPSIGVAIAPYDDMTAEGMMRKADLAMYAAKEKGRNCYAFYSDELEIENSDTHELEVKLGRAIKNEAFELYLQPQVSKVEGIAKVTGAEALIRWPQADGSMISPLRFIALAESNGMIFDIGQIVVKKVVDLYHILSEHGIDIDISFNASIKQFASNDFYDLLKDLMRREENKGIKLTMEVTESLLFEDIDAAIILLEEIKELGIKIALDDFGTGYSSMSYLNKLPLDYLKIDKSFIDEMDISSHKNLAYMIISMAKTLDLKVVAEGVEEEDQLNSLYEVDCDVIQGYYYSRPLPIREFVEFTNDFMLEEDL